MIILDSMEYASDVAAQAAWASILAPLYHYKCNDNAANTTVTDSMGVNNGVASCNTSVISTASGKIGRGFAFDGTNFINLGTSKFNVTSGAISFWMVDKSAGTGSEWMIGRGPNADMWPDMGIGYAFSPLYLCISGVGGTTPAKKIMLKSAITNGDHFIFNLNADGTATVYKNNVLVTPTETLTGFDWDNDITRQLSIANNGARADGLYRFRGTLDDIRFYNAPLSDTQRAFIYNGGAGTEVATALHCYSEASIIHNGTYSLKIIANTIGQFKRTVTPTINLSGQTTIKFWVRASRTGSNFKLGFHDSGGTTTEVTPNIASADTWQEVTLDISAVADANKDAIDLIIFTCLNADAENTVYLDYITAWSEDEGTGTGGVSRSRMMI